MAATTQGTTGTTSLSHPGSKRCHRWFFISPENCTTGSQRSRGGSDALGLQKRVPFFWSLFLSALLWVPMPQVPPPWQNKMLGPVAGHSGPVSDEPC